MPDSVHTVDQPLEPAQALRISEAGNRFEAAWQATPPGASGPRIEEFVETAGTEGAILLRHLVLLDIDYRRMRGEQPDSAEYEARFSSLRRDFLENAFSKSRVSGPKPQPSSDEAQQVQSTVLVPAIQLQQRLGRYVVGKFHARGGIGEVWMAQDGEIGRTVAVKRLRPQKEELKERFLVEAQITGQLEHPGIVPVHDLGIDEEGRPFYVMSFIQGPTLKDAIEEYHNNETSLPEPREVQAARLLENLVKICHAVAYAHHRGVVHRDLKPDNVMLGPFGEVVVLDWGLAKLRGQSESSAAGPLVQASYSSGSTATQHGTILGSPGYMAPELAVGKASEADERTDVYLLGATLYHILTGRAPRRGSSRDEMIELAKAVPPPEPRQVKKDIPRALEAICIKAMAQRKGHRYRSALELAQDLERYLAGAPVSAYREPLLVRAGRWCKQHRQGVGYALASVVVVAVLVISGVLVWEAWKRMESAQLQAQKAQHRDQAHLDLARFHRLADERQFRAASTTPAGESTAFYDARRGQRVGNEAVALAERLLPELDKLDLKAERSALLGEAYALLLLVIQVEALELDDAKASDIQERLTYAATLGGKSRTYHRLLARCYQAQGQQPLAAEEEKLAEALPPTALDYFLRAEEHRAHAGFSTKSVRDRLAWQADASQLRLALAQYDKALELEPHNFWCHLQLGRCYLSLGQGTEALAHLDTCVALQPDKPWGYSARGLARGLVGQFPGGEADLKLALEKDPEFHLAHLHRGVLAWLQRQDDQALADFAALLDLPGDQRLTEAAYYRGILHVQRKEFPQALADFELVRQDSPRFRPVYLLLAQVHFLGDEDRLGLNDLATFLDEAGPKPLDRDSPELAALRGRLLVQLVPKWGLSPEGYRAKLELAQAELLKAIKAGVQSAEVYDDLGSVAHRLGQANEALKVYAQALAAKPGRDLEVIIRTKRGWIYAQSLDPPRHDLAMKDFAEAAHLDPTHADVHAGLGYAQALLGRGVEAQIQATLALQHTPKSKPDNYLLLHNVACIYAELSRSGDKQRAQAQQDFALNLLQQAVDLCRREGDGDSESKLMEVEPSFHVLRNHPDYKKLIVPSVRQ